MAVTLPNRGARSAALMERTRPRLARACEAQAGTLGARIEARAPTQRIPALIRWPPRLGVRALNRRSGRQPVGRQATFGGPFRSQANSTPQEGSHRTDLLDAAARCAGRDRTPLL